MSSPPPEGAQARWLHAYTVLVLRVDRRLRGRGAWSLDYYGSDDLRLEIEAEESPAAGRLVEDAEHR
jgi:hypothetical protein